MPPMDGEQERVTNRADRWRSLHPRVTASAAMPTTRHTSAHRQNSQVLFTNPKARVVRSCGCAQAEACRSPLQTRPLPLEDVAPARAAGLRWSFRNSTSSVVRPPARRSLSSSASIDQFRIVHADDSSSFANDSGVRPARTNSSSLRSEFVRIRPSFRHRDSSSPKKGEVSTKRFDSIAARTDAVGPSHTRNGSSWRAELGATGSRYQMVAQQ